MTSALVPSRGCAFRSATIEEHIPMQITLPISKSYIKPLRFTAISQLIMLVLTSLMADYGVMMTWVSYAVWTYWIVALLILLRRRSNPTRWDLSFITCGFWIIAFIYILAGQHIYGYVQRVLLHH